jgi:acetyl-CoA synthetase
MSPSTATAGSPDHRAGDELDDLPETRYGKIMRRLLRDLAEGRALGDVSTLGDPSVVEAIKQKNAAGKD